MGIFRKVQSFVTQTIDRVGDGSFDGLIAHCKQSD
jgi:hypothetical protein